MKKLLLTFSLLLCVALIVGCGPKRPVGMPKLVSCVLTFQYEDGEPVGEAMVTLVPEDASLQQWSIAGSTNASGVVTIYTHADFAGAPAGKYKVVIRKTEAVPVASGEKDEYGQPIVEVHSLIAEEFSNAGKTTLSLEIGSSPARETFTVTKDARKVVSEQLR